MAFEPEKLTPAHLRAARALVGVSGETLAKKTGLGLSTIRRAEATDGAPQITRANAFALIKALEDLNVIFLEMDSNAGIGVRLKVGANKEPGSESGASPASGVVKSAT